MRKRESGGNGGGGSGGGGLGMTVEVFHLHLCLARLVSVSHGSSSLTPHLWELTQTMEANRILRVASK